MPEYPFGIRTSSKPEVDKTIAYVSRLVAAARDENRRVKVGVYGVPPLGDYWVPNQYELANRLAATDLRWKEKLPQAHADYDAWREANAYLKPIADKVDAIFPSLYVPYDEVTDQGSPSWKIFADGQIGEARKYGKPVYPFVWPQFHSSGTHKDYRYIPTDDWARVICHARSQADGLVLWGWGGFRKETWNGDAPWWQTVLRLAGDIRHGRHTECQPIFLRGNIKSGNSSNCALESSTACWRLLRLASCFGSGPTNPPIGKPLAFDAAKSAICALGIVHAQRSAV